MKERPEKYMPGWIYRSSFQAAADAILIPIGAQRKVYCHGELFMNVDRWTFRFFCRQMAEWVDDNPYLRPDKKTVKGWVERANKMKLSDEIQGFPEEPQIHIPSLPNQMTKYMADCLRGGSFHEALHTAYDIRSEIYFEEVWPIIDENWDLVPNWKDFVSSLLGWMNELSDMKIERRGITDYEGIERFIHCVHEYRVTAENEDILAAKMKGVYQPNAHSFALKAFRSCAFGYSTPKLEEALEGYDDEMPRIVAFVKYGPLAPFVEAAQNQDDMPRAAHLDLAMKIVGTFYAESMLKADAILGDLLLKEHMMQKWGHCRVEEGNGGSGRGFAGISQCIMRDASATPQHKQTMEVLQDGVNDLIGPHSRGAMSYDHDRVYLVEPSSQGIPHDRMVALERTKEMRRSINFYRSRLRVLLKAQEIVGEYHGLPDGIELSDETMVETVVDMKSNEYPTQAFYDEDERIDTSTAAYVLGDMSYSMSGVMVQACKVILSLLDPLDKLGAATMASGFYSAEGSPTDQDKFWKAHRGWSSSDEESDLTDEEKEKIKDRYFRAWAVNHAVFKMWHEKFERVRYRFANYEANGGTPMADGIQFALNALQERREGHRLLFVVTDGMPDDGCMPLIMDLLALAKQAEIHVVGVGFGHSAVYVKEVFDDYVWDASIEELPRSLVAKLHEIMSLRETKIRGRRLHHTVIQRRRVG